MSVFNYGGSRSDVRFEQRSRGARNMLLRRASQRVTARGNGEGGENLLARPARRCTSAAQSVCGLMRCMELWFVRRGTRDLQALMQPMASIDGKSTPRVEPIVEIIDLLGLTL